MAALTQKLEDIRSNTGLRSREVAELLETSPQTVSRWQTGKTQPHPNSLEKILQLNWLAERLHELFPPEEARLWLFSRHRLLGGERPVDRIQQDKLDDVLELIDQLESGAFI